MSFVTALKILIEYLVSVFIWSILNPFGFVQTIRQTTGQLMAISRAIFKGVECDDNISFNLPFEGTWRVFNGGFHKQSSHSWHLVGQRYAYDFVITDDLGKTYQDNSSIPENYYAFGKSILAASDGTVQEVRNDIKDYRRAGTGWIDIRTPDIRGNYVVIKHTKNTYTLYAHLKYGSITVKPGDKVVAGQKIGECGHSGHSSEPHLHFQLQDRVDFYSAISLLIKFRDFERVENDTVRCVEIGYIEKGQMVRSSNPCLSGIRESVNFIKPNMSDLVLNVFTSIFAILGVFVVVARIIEFILNVF